MDEPRNESSSTASDEPKDELNYMADDEPGDTEDDEPGDMARDEPTRTTATKPPASRRRKVLWVIAIIVAVVLAVKFLFPSQGSGPAPSSSSGATSAPTTAPGATMVPTETVPNVGTSPAGTGPIILMNPGFVRQGTSVSVDGYGFDPGSVVDLIVKQQGAGPSQSVATFHADKTGSFYETLPLPSGLSSGTFTLAAAERNSDKTALATGTVSNGAALVTMKPIVGQVGQVVGVSGSGFSADEAIDVYWNSLASQPITTLHADGGGNVRAQVRVPFAAVGENNFIFVGTRSQSPVTISFLLLNLYPTAKPSTYAIRADNALSFSGKGFGPNERVLIFLDSMNSPPIATVQADSTGAFKNAGAFEVPYTLKGKQTLIFVGEQSRAPATIAFSVLPYTPHAQASTYGGLPGTTVSFYAFDFGRNEVVHVYLGRGSGGGGTMVSCFKTDDRGDAGAAGSYIIPGSAQGKLVFTLVGSESGASTTAAMTVMASSVPVQVPAQPPFTCPLDHQAPPSTPSAAGNPGSTPSANPPTQPQAPGGTSTGSRPTGLRPQALAGDARRITQAPPSPARGAMLAAFLFSAGLVGSRPTARVTTSDADTRRKTPSVRQSASGGRAAITPDSEWLVGIGLLLFWLGLCITLVMRAYRDENIDATANEDVDDPEAACDRLGRDETQLQPMASPHRRATAMTETRVSLPPARDHKVPPVPIPSKPENRSASALPARLQSMKAAQAMADPSAMSQAAGMTDRGIVRQTAPNEDCALLAIAALHERGSLQPYGLFAVADGVGGCANGRESSRLVASVIADYTLSTLDADRSGAVRSLTDVLVRAIARANAELCEQNARRRTDMAATVTAAILVQEVAYIANVGHCRTYVFRPEGLLRQITTDHSLVAALATEHLLPRSALYWHPGRNELYRCVGRAEQCSVDAFEAIVKPQDRILLCSNGLWQMVGDWQIEGILRAATNPHLAAERLIAAAKRNGGKDNASAIVARPLDDRVPVNGNDLPFTWQTREETGDVRLVLWPGLRREVPREEGLR